MKTMIQIILFTLLTISLTLPAFGQDDKIMGIQDKFETINQDTAYTILTLENEEFLEQMTDGGGQLTGYFKGDIIYKIHERVRVSYCERTFEYYFWNGQLIFIVENEDAFPYVDSLATLDYTSKEMAFEGRYYFDEGNLIKTKTRGQKRIPDDIDSDTKEKEKLLQTSAQYNKTILTKYRN